MLSAKGQESDQNTAARVGANAFLSKPVDRIVLLNKVTEFLGGQKDPNAT
jgi:DNA-binding response OmpR family regulator